MKDDDALTPREQTVMRLAQESSSIRAIALELGISESTVKVHRCNMMRKMRLASFAELCRAVDKLKLPS